jgi:hypothetical protein
MIVKAEGQIVAWSPASAAPSACRRSPEGVIDAHIQVIAAVVRGCDEVKILKASGKIRLWDVLQ